MSAQHKAEVIASLLDGVRWNGSHDAFRACCPAHGGRNETTLSVRIADSDRVLLHCFAGCGGIDILQALGLDWTAIMPDRPRDARMRGAAPDYRDALLRLEHESRVLHVCAEDMLRGKVTEALVARVAEAANRIHATTECEMRGRRRRAA